MKPLRLRLGKAEAGSVDKEAWDAQQLHGCPSQAGGDHVVDKESAIVWEENTPVRGAEGERMLTQMAKRAAGGCHWVLLLGCPGGAGAPCYSLEFDIGLVQKVDVKEPAEKKIQAAGERRAAQKGGTHRATWGAPSWHAPSPALGG